MKRKPKIRVAAILSGVVTLAGIVGGPLGVAVVGAKASAIIALVGALAQSVTKPAVRREHER